MEKTDMALGLAAVGLTCRSPNSLQRLQPSHTEPNTALDVQKTVIRVF